MTGLADVLSTARRAPALWAISEAAWISVTSHRGLLGVSSQTNAVLAGRTALARASRSALGTNSTSRPQVRAKSFSQLRSDQYMTLGATTWLPGLRDMNSAVAAAMPEEKTRAPCPP